MTILLDWSGEAFDLSGFETMNSPVIDETTGPPGNTKSMRITCGGQGDRGYQSLSGQAFQINFNTDYHYRWWMKMAPDLAWSNQNKFKSNRWGSGSLPGFLTSNLTIGGFQPGEHDRGFTSDQGSGSGGDGPSCGSYNFNPATNAAVQNWQQYIVRMKTHSTGDATDGVMQLGVWDAAGDGGFVSSGLTGVRWWTEALRDGQTVFEQKGFVQAWCFPQDVNGNIWIARARVATTFEEAFDGEVEAPPAGGIALDSGGWSVARMAPARARLARTLGRRLARARSVGAGAIMN